MRTNHSFDEGSLVQAAHGGGSYWPALHADTGTILLIGKDQLDRIDGRIFEAGRFYAGRDRAGLVFDWMGGRPAEWPLWARAAILFGEAALRAMVIEPAEQASRQAAEDARKARLDEEARLERHSKVDLFVLDPRGGRTGLSLKSGDESSSFFIMRFSEKWERERVLDWLHWQRDRFLAFRDLHDSDGSAALERVIIAGMRETEAKVKAQGLASGGRRPLRFWRGEP